ncbi:MAG: terminase [Rhodospirillaceae bacterium]|nr:terminase [Rhodospirillaceae bacterium]
MSVKRSARRDALFLDALVETGSLAAALAASGYGRVQMQRARERDSAFARAWDEALEAAVDALEQEARRRAVEGVEKPVWYRGEQVGTVREVSDRLLLALLKAHRPERFGGRSVTGAKDRWDGEDLAGLRAALERKLARLAGEGGEGAA